MSFSTKFTEGGSPFDKDLATLSNYADVRTTHIDLDWTIDWEKQVISGHANLKLEATQDINEIVLDSSYLHVSEVQVDGQKVKWEHGERIGAMGEGLKISVEKGLKAGQEFGVKVIYSTTKDCTAVGWLNPVQTKSGKYPYLYSQSQAIHARSLLPCQDTPAIKATYSSKVRSVLPVLMSGLRISPPSEETPSPGKEAEYVYDQPCAIPSYLIAIASGELVYRTFDKLEGKSWKSGCWAEPATIDAAYWEFKKDTANFVATAEKSVSDYRFGVYDILFLPDSFPYGGMENSCLTFATPSVIAGDRSAVDVCAHEISHSWFGNGIGCASWCHFWLNESWTTYLERLLVRETEGEAARQLSFLIGRKGLREDLKRYQEAGEPRLQRLVTEYKLHEDRERHNYYYNAGRIADLVVADEGYSQVAYEKGSNLLLHIERLVGGLDVFIPYMKDYDRTFTGTSITTDQWRNHLFHYFGSQPNGQELVQKLGQLDWDEWIHGDGLDLCIDIQYDDSLSKQCVELADKWDKERDSDYSSFSSDDVKSFITSQKNVFLDALDMKSTFPPAAIKTIGKLYAFDSSENAEIRNRFYRIALKSGPEYAQDAAKWVVNKGRMKFCRPTYRGIFTQDPELAKKTFLKHVDFYHPIARKMIAKDLGVQVE